MDADPAWQMLDERTAWEQFDDMYGFRASTKPSRWPAITEPPGSVTIDLRPIFENSGPQFYAGELAVNALVFVALARIVPAGEQVTVLDWQHPSYSFWPNRALTPPSEWLVPPFPDGDYCIFLRDDMKTGTFGHPWERSLCVFGQPLVDVLVPMLTSWLPILRDARPQL